jgi:hypothetical protein
MQIRGSSFVRDNGHAAAMRPVTFRLAGVDSARSETSAEAAKPSPRNVAHSTASKSRSTDAVPARPSKDRAYQSAALIRTSWDYADYGRVVIGRDVDDPLLSQVEVGNVMNGVAQAQYRGFALLQRLSAGPDASITAAAANIFGTSPYGLNAWEFSQIRNMVGEIVAGLSSRTTINLPRQSKILAEGWVPYFQPGPYGPRVYGDINLAREYVASHPHDLVRLIFHEASHKFANTEDIDQFNWPHYYAGGGLRYWGRGVPDDQRMRNADNVAAFMTLA